MTIDGQKDWNRSREEKKDEGREQTTSTRFRRVFVLHRWNAVCIRSTIARLHKSIWIGGTRPRSICCHYFAIPAKRTRWTVDQGREEAHSVRYAARNRREIYRFIDVSRWQIEREIAMIIYTLHRYDLFVSTIINETIMEFQQNCQSSVETNFSSRSKINIVRSISDERS